MAEAPPKRSISMDWWTVIAALSAVALVRAGVFARIPW